MNALDPNGILTTNRLRSGDLNILQRKLSADSNSSKIDCTRASVQGITAQDRNSKLYKTCQEFESIFIKQMLNVMRQTIPQDGLFSGGLAEDIFEDLLYDEYALKMAQNAGFGLADTLYKSLSTGVEAYNRILDPATDQVTR